MKIVRFRNDKRVAYGVVDGDEITEIRGSIFTRFRLTDNKLKLAQVKLLPPTEPVQMFCPGLNFADHLKFAGEVLGKDKMPGVEHPEPWHKGRNALIGHEDTIVIPKDSDGEVHYEGEVVAVIGKTCRRVSPKDALRCITGYTCGNDVSERVWQKADWTFWRAKGADTFAPVGPWIETSVDPSDLDMIVRLNGEEVQRCNTRDMIHDFSEVISYISQQVTLQPGDLIFSGSAGATTAIRPEDVVEVEVTGVGVLRNYVRAEE
jgi:2-keto-4-pentenoate hydratase/2-oxohepta-3-ene-1,7-dioic acid hydratase in catechol pathway